MAEENLSVEECISLDSVRKRQFVITEEISEETVSYIVPWIYRINESDDQLPPEERQPIRLMISSPGGSVFDGFAIINAMEQSKTPVWTYNIGYCFSMAFHIFISGHKRFAYKDSIFLHHDGSDYMVGSTLKNQDYAEFSQIFRDRVIVQNVLKHTRISREELIQNERREWYMFADEAKILGIFDNFLP